MLSCRAVLCLFGILLCVAIVSGQRPSPSSIRFRTGASKVLGVNTTVAIYEVEFDQTLVLTEARICRPNACPTQDCFPGCNYAAFAGCGTSTGGCTCLNSDWCDRHLIWEEMIEGDPMEEKFIGLGEYHDYRFFLEPGCKAVEFKLNKLSGTAVAAISTSQANPSFLPGRYDTLIGETTSAQQICPGESHWVSGTYFVRVQSLHGAARYDLSVHTYDIANDLFDPPEDSCTGDSCELRPEVPTLVTVGPRLSDRQQLTYVAPTCQRVLISHEAVSGPNNWMLTLSVDANLLESDSEWTEVATLLYGEQRVFTLCPDDDLGASATLYMNVRNLQPPVEEGATPAADSQAYIMITPLTELNQALWSQRSLSELPQSPATADLLRGSVELRCDAQDSDVAARYHCESGASVFGGSSCSTFYAGLNTGLLDFLWPIPRSMRFFDVAKFDVVLEEAAPFSQDDHSLRAMVLLELRDNTQRIVPFPAGEEELLNRCTVHFPHLSPLSNVRGESPDNAPNGNVASPSLSSCSFEEWRALSEILSTLRDLASTAPVSTYAAIAARFQYDIGTLTTTWTGCQDFVSSYLLPDRQRLQFLETARCLGDPNDPCCNNELSWTECCFTRDFNVFVEALSTVNRDRVDLECENPACTEALLEDYSFVRIFTGDEDGCRDILPSNFDTNMDQNLAFFRDCKQAAFGFGADATAYQQDGIISCKTNADCPGNPPLCSPLSKTCVLNRVEAEEQFFTCLADAMPVPMQRLARELLGEAAGLNPTETSLEALLLANGFTSNCVATSTPLSPYGAQFKRSAQFPYCPSCTQSCHDLTCALIPACEGRRLSGRLDGTCHFAWVPQENQPNECVSDRVCNWDPSITDSATCLAPSSQFFCAACDVNGENCLVVDGPATGDQCLSTPLCVMPDGSTITGISVAECSRRRGCDSLCPGGVPCANEDDCVFQSGRCVDREGIWDLLSEALNGEQVTGVCVFDLEPFNRPDCTDSLVHVRDLPSSRGCLRFEHCNGTSCTQILRDRDSCLNAGGLWQEIPDTKDNCLSLTRCSEPDSRRLLSPKVNNECRACSGSASTVQEWIEGTWGAGTPVQLSWMRREMLPRYTVTQTVDFVGLEKVFRATVTGLIRPQLATELACSYSPQQQLLDSIVCACQAPEEGDEGRPVGSECFDRSSLALGSGIPCKGSAFFTTAPPATLETDSTSFSAADPPGTCAPFQLELINARELDPNTSPPITTFARRPDQDAGRFEYVLNDGDARVGQAVGDGVTLSFVSENRFIRVRLCLDQKSDITLDLDKYPEPDFGFRVGDKLRPYGVPVEIDEKGFVCAFVEPTEEAQTYMPIIRIVDWEDEERVVFTDGERGLLYFVASLFTLVALAALVEICLVIAYQKGFNPRQATNLLFVFFLLYSTIRAVYFFLFASKVFDGSDDITEYILVELPTFLYLGGIILITISFSITLLREKYPQIRKPRNFWIAFGLAMLILAMFYVTIVLIFQFVVLGNDDDDDGQDLCSLLVGTDETDNSARTVRLIYQSIVAFIALSIFVSLTVVGYTVWKKAQEYGYGANKMLYLVMIASASVLADSVAFIIYYAVDEPSPYFTIALIFTEIIPTCVMIWLLHQKSPSSYSTGSSSGTRHTSTSG